MNHHLEFGKNYEDIYPPKLELKKERITVSKVSFLNLSITTENKKSKT